jgi:hypothetical protein
MALTATVISSPSSDIDYWQSFDLHHSNTLLNMIDAHIVDIGGKKEGCHRGSE